MTVVLPVQGQGMSGGEGVVIAAATDWLWNFFVSIYSFGKCKIYLRTSQEPYSYSLWGKFALLSQKVLML